jgi:endonuclease YncB( thermonuclease family)
LILGQDVDVEIRDTDRYKRKVCRISKDRMDVNLEMVKRGYAWAYVHYLRRPHASQYIEAERDARAKHLGLWQQSNPQPPWEYRRMKK